MPLFQNESKCETFHMKMSSACRFIFMQISHLRKNGFALRLALKLRHIGTIREIKFDVTWSYVKRQTAKLKLLPSVFSSLNSRVKMFVFVAISRRQFSIFM